MMNLRPFLALLLLAGCTPAAGTSAPTASPSPVAASPTPPPTATPTPTPSATPLTTDVQQTTRAGVGYSILVPAPAGAAVCKFGDTVSMEYTGWLTNGTKFDSSVGKDPYVFKLGAGRVIQGWDLGIPGMAVGEVRKLVLPPDLAYGSQGQGAIPPDATLIFQVKLVAIQ
jgi:FKBP-type peptidyl-prolyl cis-trans isomerase